MSLQFNATSDGATRTGMTIGETYTLMCQFMPEVGSTGWIMGICEAASSGHHSGIRIWYTGGNPRAETSLGGQQITYGVGVMTLNAWYSIAVTQHPTNGLNAYIWDASGTLTGSDTRDASYKFTPDLIWFGVPDKNRDGVGVVGNTGCFRYGKFWNGVELTPGELLTERTSSTCVKAGGTSLWPFADNTSPCTDSIGSNTLTLTSGDTSGSEPSYVTGGGGGPGIILPPYLYTKTFTFGKSVVRK